MKNSSKKWLARNLYGRLVAVIFAASEKKKMFRNNESTGKAKRLGGLVVATALMGVAGLANAVPTYCSAPGAHADGLDFGDVTYSITGAAPFQDATDCYGVVDDNIQKTTNLDGIWGIGWQYGDASNEVAATVSLFGGDFTFTVAGMNNATSGAYVVTGVDQNGLLEPNFPFPIDLIVALKAGNSYALYYFDDAMFDGSGGGAWEIVFNLNPAGNPNALSHGIVFVREGTSTRVPEPVALSLLGLGLLMVAAVRRRRQAVS
jgi:hypothetical protein